jgi:hypothetical protein
VFEGGHAIGGSVASPLRKPRKRIPISRIAPHKAGRCGAM